MNRYKVTGNDGIGWTVKERIGWFKWATWYRKFATLAEAKQVIETKAEISTKTYYFDEYGKEDLSHYSW